MNRHTHRQAGFTLVEVIVVLVLIGIVGAVLAPVMGRALSHSADGSTRLREIYSLQRVVENIQAARTNGLAALTVEVGPEGSERDNRFGRYRVIHNRFVLFSGGAETSGGTDLLKVTVAGPGGDALTVLLVE